MKIQNATEEIELENLRITKEFLDEYYLSKGELREARQMLRKLAEKTVSACKDIKLLIETWDDTSSIYIEKQFSFMKQLLKDSVTILGKSKEKYNNAVIAIEKSTTQLQQFANKITSMTTKNTEEHKAWTGKVRAAVYGTNGAVSVGLIFADIFGCLGNSITCTFK